MKHLLFVCVLLTLAACSSTTSTPTNVAGSPIPPHEATVLFARNDDLWRVNSDGRQVVQLTTGKLLNWNTGEGDWYQATLYRPPQISPDGRWITLSRTGRDLWLVNVNEHSQTKLSDAGAPQVAWSTDSRYIAYVPETVSNEDVVHITHIPSGQSHSHYSFPKSNWSFVTGLVWSSDSRALALACCFTATQSSASVLTGDIKRIDLTGGQITSLGAVTTTVASRLQLCMDADNHVSTQWEQGRDLRCSENQTTVAATAPDGSISALLSPAQSADTYWNGPSRLTLRQEPTGQLLWQHEFTLTLKIVVWSSDNRYLFVDDASAHSPIWRLSTSTEPKELVPLVQDGFLIGILPQ
jgi:hypothetical protein